MERQNFSLAIFGKDLKDLELKDLELFFSEDQVETSFLEFKSGEAHIEKLIQEICAFLNTGGGILVLGSPKEDKDKNCSGQLTEVKGCKNEDQLSRKISGNITPLPSGIEYHPIKHQNGYSYVIQIQPSPYAPHQDNLSKIYYIRINEEKKAAPHSLIESLFFKRQRPKFNLKNEKLERDNSNIRYSGGVINEAPYPADRISHLINVIGVKSCVGDNFKEGDPFNFQCIRQNEYSLTQEIQWLFNFEIDPFFEEPFLISHLVWSKESKTFQGSIVVDPPKNHSELTFKLFDEEESAMKEYINLREINLQQIIQELTPKDKFNYSELLNSLHEMMDDYSIIHDKYESGETFSYHVSKSDFVEMIFTEERARMDVKLKYSIKGDLIEVRLNPPVEN